MYRNLLSKCTHIAHPYDDSNNCLIFKLIIIICLSMLYVLAIKYILLQI